MGTISGEKLNYLKIDRTGHVAPAFAIRFAPGAFAIHTRT